jgi:sulfate adenylyltransferase
MLTLSGTEFRRRLQEGLDIPEWFSFPEVVAELRRTHPPRRQQGFTVFSDRPVRSPANPRWPTSLLVKLLEMGGRPVTLARRRHRSQAISRPASWAFRKEHRNINILRIGFVASEITKKRRHRHLCAHRALHHHPPRGSAR